MKTVPEFEYDLWKDKERKCFIRVKKTGEVTEITNKTFQFLRNESMKLYRSRQGHSIYEVKGRNSVVVGHTTNLSLCVDETNEETGITWLKHKFYIEDEITTKLAIEDFSKLLTEKQLAVFNECILDSKKFTEYANERNIDKTSVRDIVKRIRIKAEKYFFN